MQSQVDKCGKCNAFNSFKSLIFNFRLRKSKSTRGKRNESALKKNWLRKKKEFGPLKKRGKKPLKRPKMRDRRLRDPAEMTPWEV